MKEDTDGVSVYTTFPRSKLNSVKTLGGSAAALGGAIDSVASHVSAS
jgi:hypothetical protein